MPDLAWATPWAVSVIVRALGAEPRENVRMLRALTNLDRALSGLPALPEDAPEPDPLSVRCPLCGSAPGLSCRQYERRGEFKTVTPHGRRRTAARHARDEEEPEWP